MYRRKLIKKMLTYLYLVVLLGGTSLAHVMIQTEVEDEEPLTILQSFETSFTAAEGAMKGSGSYSSSSFYYARGLIQTADGGFVFFGSNQTTMVGSDEWLVKLDAQGTREWQQTYSGHDYDYIYGVIQTRDGGFALFVHDYYGDFRELRTWLVKTDAHGVEEWHLMFSTPGIPLFIETADGGFLLSGGEDGYLMKANASGVIQWTQLYDIKFGGLYTETADGSFVIVGDGWLVRTNAYGVVQWTRSYDPTFRIFIETRDGGFVLVGDNLLRKLDASGEVIWTQPMPTVNSDIKLAMETRDGGFALVGNVPSGFWLGKTDGRGVLQWDRIYDSGYNLATEVIQAGDGGFALVGGYGFWREDVHFGGGMFVKTDADGTVEWTQTYNLKLTRVIQMVGGGFLLVGKQEGFDSFRCLMKIDSHGIMKWTQFCDKGGTYIIKTMDGGFAVTQTIGHFLVKIDARGDLEWKYTYGEDIYVPPDFTPPELSAPEDLTYEEGMTGQDITWTVGDYFPDTYELYQNGTQVVSGMWTNGTIHWNGDYFTQGSYNVTLVVWDVDRNHAIDTVGVIVSAACAPELSAPNDITYEEGAIGQVITWTVGDQYPGTYALYINSVQVASEVWTNGTLPWNGDALTQGSYNVTLVIWDTAHNWGSNTVWVTVMAPVTTTQAPVTTSQTSVTTSLPELPMLRTIGFLSLAALFSLGVRRIRPFVSTEA